MAAPQLESPRTPSRRTAMNERFTAHVMTRDVVAELRTLYPANPFVTAEYFAAREQAGDEVWVAGMRRIGSDLSEGCAVFLKRGLLNHELTIISLPPIAPESGFWPGLMTLCLRQGVTHLTIDTYASPNGTRIPRLCAFETRRERCEYVLDLCGDLEVGLSPGHRERIAHARHLGMMMVSARSIEALRVHFSLTNQSLIERGESGEVDSFAERLALVETGAAEIYQAVLDGSVLASALIIQAPAGAFYQSGSGASAWRDTGASHFLWHEMALGLQRKGATTFSLGGVAEHSDRAQWRIEFGATPSRLEAATFDVGPAWKRRASQVAALASSTTSRLQSLIRGG